MAEAVNTTRQTQSLQQPTETIVTDYSPPSDEQARWFFDYEHLYWTIKAHLYGGWLTEDSKGYYVIKKPVGARPFMNDDGIESTMSLINGFVSKVGALTVLDDERIRELSLEINHALIQFYINNMDKFDLTEDKATVVIRMLMTNVEANLRKSFNGASLRLIGSTERRIETRSEGGQKKIFGIPIPGT